MENNKKIKVAILGGGINSAVGHAHICSILMSNRFIITSACFSRDSKINSDSLSFYNLRGIKVYASLEELVLNDSKNFDYIIVLTPTDSHFEQLRFLLKQDINVICEKALVGSLYEAKALKDIIKNSKSKLHVIYNYIGFPMVKEMKNMIQIGKIGKINNIQIEMPQEGFIRMTNNNPIIPQKWRLKDGEIPTISLDLGVHLHILIYYLTELNPIATVGIFNTFGNFSEITDDINAIIQYEDGVNCNMWFSKAAIGYLNGLKIRIFGKNGSLKWVQSNPDIVNYSDIHGNKFIIDRNSPDLVFSSNRDYNRFKPGHPSGFVEALTNYYIDIANVHFEIDNEKVEVFGFEQSFLGLKLFDAIGKSALEKKWIEIN